MYGIVEINGHQYQVKAGDFIDVEKLSAEVDSTVNFDKVLFIGGESSIVGAPVVNNASVKAKVISQERDRKILILKRAPGKWRKTRGHRQSFTGLLITEISDGKGNVAKVTADNTRAQKYLKK